MVGNGDRNKRMEAIGANLLQDSTRIPGSTCVLIEDNRVEAADKDDEEDASAVATGRVWLSIAAVSVLCEVDDDSRVCDLCEK